MVNESFTVVFPTCSERKESLHTKGDRFFQRYGRLRMLAMPKDGLDTRGIYA